MIVYFADREMQVLGHATTNLPNGYVIIEDLKTEDVESGVATFSCKIGYNKENRLQLERMTNAGNYLLRSHDSENEFYTIIDTEIDTRDQSIYVYAEDAGLDLLNEIAGEFEADESHNAEWYINKYIIDSGFEIGINEIPETTVRKLSWEGESTVTARLASIATQFGDYEISYSFDIKGLIITNKYINIHKQRGKDAGEQLRLNIDVDRIVTTKSVANLATAFVCEGGVRDGEEEPITLKGYTVEDEDAADFFIDDNGVLKAKTANEKWSRYVWNKEPNRLKGYEGYIVRPYSYNTTEQGTLCSHAITELKKVCDMEVNYEIDINRLPEGVKIGDRVNIIDDAGEMYVSTRVLKLETSIVDDSYTATLGDHIIKTSGISQKVAELAEQFAKTSQSAARALTIATNAKTTADNAQAQANAAASEAATALETATEAQESASAAVETATNAQAEAQAAQAAVDKVESSVSSLETTVTEAKAAADNAEKAAEDATALAGEAKTAATNAQTAAAEAKTASGEAQTKADSAITKADTAIGTADNAKTNAESAIATAEAAKADAEQAEKDVAALGENLETVKTTMSTDYARKTDLTETTANLQTQISQNAAEISSTASKVQVIDETANDAKTKAEAAQSAADAAQTQADQATAEALAAQNAANAADAAAKAAQAEADNAKEAAETAQGIADKAEADLEAAKADLATVSGRVDATEEEITAAQEAVTRAQTAADNAKADADAAAQKATDAQTTANTAVTNAANAQTAADNAANQAALAQQTADEAKGDASAAQSKADEAASTAAEAQRTADTAVSNAATAQAKADQAALDAATAQQAADDADAKAAQAQTDLDTAKQNLASVTSRVGATEEEIAAAQADVVKAQEAADLAKEEAEAAQSTADTAKADAAKAQTAADDAKTAADKAQQAADEAKKAADDAQDAVDTLAVRVTKAETDIIQTNEKIELCATKTEVDAIVVGGRNLLLNTEREISNNEYCIAIYTPSSPLVAGETYTVSLCVTPASGVTKFGVFVSEGSKALTTLDVSGTAKQVVSQTFEAGYYPGATPEDKAGNALVRVYRFPNDGTVTSNSTIHWIKVEKGTKATDWSPAPEDVDSKFLDYYTKNETEAAIKVQADSITSSVKATYTTKEETAAVQESATAANNKIDNLEIGATNLIGLKHLRSVGLSSIDISSTNEILCVGVSTDGISALLIDRLYPAGVYTINWTRTFQDGTTTKSARMIAEKQLDSTWSYNSYYDTKFGRPYFKDCTLPCAFSFESELKIGFVILNPSNASSTQTITGLKLEKGTKATDWSSAPEDAESGGTNLLSVSKINSALGVTTTKEFELSAWASTFVSTENVLKMLEPATQYTIQFNATLTKIADPPTFAGSFIGFVFRFPNGTNQNCLLDDAFPSDAAVGTSKKYQQTFTTPDDISGATIYCYTRRWTTEGATPDGSDTFKFTNFKIEKGIQATDWTLAPEDVATTADVETLVTEAVDVVDQKIDNLEIGGRNLLMNSRLIVLRSNNNTLYPITYTEENESGRIYHRYKRSDTTSNPTTMSLYSAIPISETTESLTGKEITFSFLMRCSHNTTFSVMNILVVDGTSYDLVPSTFRNIGTSWERISVTATITQEYEINSTNVLRFNPLQMLIPEGEVDNFYIDTCEWKIEKGSKATDWTPAPEDVDKSIEDSAEAVKEIITEKEASILTTAESNILTAVETNYVKNGDFTDFKETTEATLTELPDQISMKFAAAKEYTDTVNGEVQAIKENLEKHFDFSLDGLTIRAGESSMTLTLDNDEIVFKKNGEEFGRWVGDTFIIKKIRIGSAAIEAQSSGSVKIGAAGG